MKPALTEYSLCAIEHSAWTAAQTGLDLLRRMRSTVRITSSECAAMPEAARLNLPCDDGTDANRRQTAPPPGGWVTSPRNALCASERKD